MAGSYALPPPAPLDIHSDQAGEKWKRFKRAWDSYSLATGLSEKSEDVQVATLLTVIGEEAREVYATFAGWAEAGDHKKIEPVLGKFGQYCKPQKNIPFERYRFNRRCQEAGESYEQYRTALRKLAENCDFGTITPDEILRDRLIFGIRDGKTRERLLREPALTLKRTDEICRSAESAVTQLRLVDDGQGTPVNALATPARTTHDCPNCGRKHDSQRREMCPAFGKTCRRCNKRNHFAVKCRSRGRNQRALVVDTDLEPEAQDEDETLTLSLPVHCLDDSQFITLRIKSGSYIRFQVDTGAQCNVLPLDTYKKATGDNTLRLITPTNTEVSRLQRMLLQLQKYSLEVGYKKGKYMHLADTLSRAYLPEEVAVAEVRELEEVSHTESLAMAPEDLERLKLVASQDAAMEELRRVIQQGWPPHKAGLPDAVRPYFEFRDQMTTQDQLVFKGPTVVVPAALRAEMMAKCHATHIGIEGCLRRARESMYWPRMSSDMKDYISRCDVCLAYRNAPQRETLVQHEITARPWAKVGADLCDFRGRTLLVVCDYFSGFIEVERLQTTTTVAVSKALKALFARYGVPDILVTDNGPQFSSAEFVGFAKRWGFQHTTSSPHYPQSNGRAENAVKTVKRLLTKCQESRQSRVPSPAGLEKHTYRGAWIKSSTEIPWQAMPHTPPCDRDAAQTRV